MSTIENTTAIKFQVGQFVKDVLKHNRRGKVIGFIEPIGRSGEWSYDVLWDDVGSGGGWRDCDLMPCL